MRIANDTYLIVATMINVQMTSEHVPSMTAGSGLSPASVSTILKV